MAADSKFTSSCPHTVHLQGSDSIQQSLRLILFKRLWGSSVNTSPPVCCRVQTWWNIVSPKDSFYSCFIVWNRLFHIFFSFPFLFSFSLLDCPWHQSSFCLCMRTKPNKRKHLTLWWDFFTGGVLWENCKEKYIFWLLFHLFPLCSGIILHTCRTKRINRWHTHSCRNA